MERSIQEELDGVESELLLVREELSELLKVCLQYITLIHHHQWFDLSSWHFISLFLRLLCYIGGVGEGGKVPLCPNILGGGLPSPNNYPATLNQAYAIH